MSFSGAGGIRRPGGRGGKLKPPTRPTLGGSSHEEMHSRLMQAIAQVQGHNHSTLSFEEHYRYAYNLVLHSHGRMLYDSLKSQIQTHLTNLCAQNIVPAFPPGGAASITAGIVLPENGASTSSSATATSSSSAKGKGKATASLTEQSGHDSLDIKSETGLGSTLGQSGDGAGAMARTQAGEKLLNAIKELWDDHCACMAKIRDLLKYMDRVWVSQNKELAIWDLGLELFRDHVLRSSKFPIHVHLYSTLLTQIQMEREGMTISRSALKSNVDMLLSLTYPQRNVALAQRPTIYKAEFEPAFLATSEKFYKAEAQRMLHLNDAAQYLRHVERRFVEEGGRVAVFLNSATDAPLRQRMEACLLAEHLQQIIDMPGSGLVSMLDENRQEDLGRLFRLFSRVQENKGGAAADKPDGPRVLKTGIKAYVNAKGKEINAAASSGAKVDKPEAGADGAKPDGDGDAEGAAPSKRAPKPEAASAASTPQAAMALRWVEDVLTFKAKFDDILKNSFGGDAGCEVAINEAFETFINTNQRAPEFISLFIDENLKKGLKGKSEQEVEEVLNRTIEVFRFLHEKDAFERYYKTHLAKRLLQGRSVSDDAERGMMAKLKVECGHGYVQKLQGMLNDMKVSEETMAAFNDSIGKSGKPMPFDLSVSILTSTYWPLSAQAQPCTMAPSMMEARVRFERFYQSRHSGRLLTWHPNLGMADVRVQFKARKHELNVSTYALVVLLLFEDVAEGETLGYEDIRGSTGIAPAELNRTLQSLACAKYKILIKEPKGKEVANTDRFAFNEGFTCNLARIKIATVAARVESASERKETNLRVEEERKNLTEACIVRVMKDRKRMAHNDLVSEVVRQLSSRFHAQPQSIKRRIEGLIDREYLEREEGKRDVYAYVA